MRLWPRQSTISSARSSASPRCQSARDAPFALSARACSRAGRSTALISVRRDWPIFRRAVALPGWDIGLLLVGVGVCLVVGEVALAQRPLLELVVWDGLAARRAQARGRLPARAEDRD